MAGLDCQRSDEGAPNTPQSGGLIGEAGEASVDLLKQGEPCRYIRLGLLRAGNGVSLPPLG